MSMRQQSIFVLAALSDGPRHGYALLSEVTAISNGEVQLQVGSLYTILDRLQSEGLVRITAEEVVSGRTRRYLELTDAGRTELEHQAARLEATARAVRARAPRTRPDVTPA